MEKNDNEKTIIGTRKIYFDKDDYFEETKEDKSKLSDIKITKELEEKESEDLQEEIIQEEDRELYQSELFKERKIADSHEKKTLNQKIDVILNHSIFKNVILVIAFAYIIFNLLIMGGNIIHSVMNREVIEITFSMWQYILYVICYVMTLLLSVLSIIKVKNPYLIILIIIVINIIV